jgi:hypothetical protein
MAFPTQKQIELPLLQTLEALGGQAKPQEVYPRVAEYFPQLTKEDLEARLPHSPTTMKW